MFLKVWGRNGFDPFLPLPPLHPVTGDRIEGHGTPVQSQAACPGLGRCADRVPPERAFDDGQQQLRG